MLQQVRRRLAAQGDEGFTLIEVMVAMLIFALISVGVIHTMLSVLSLGRDSRARQVAANLAAEAIDRSREEGDIFDLLDGTFTHELNGDTFTVQRNTAWVSDPGTDLQCGGGGGTLRYKRVNITVTWENMRAGTQPVRADTVIDPKERINDPAKGTILISVLNGEGLGAEGVSVTAQTVNSSGSLVGSPLPAATTDAQGCAYVLRADPGNYRVTISKAGYRDVSNEATPYTVTGVVAGATASVAFSYDQLSTFRVHYADGSPSFPVAANAMPTTMVSTYGTQQPTAAAGGNPRTFSLFPFASGYDIMAGRYVPPTDGDTPTPGCLSPDASAWPGGTRPGRVAAAPGETVDAYLSTGVLTVNVGSVPWYNRYLRAVSVASGTGTDDPGCGEGYDFVFNPAPLSSTGTASIVLPYGSWELYYGSSSTPSTRITEAQITLETPGLVQGGANGVVTLDPR